MRTILVLMVALTASVPRAAAPLSDRSRPLPQQQNTEERPSFEARVGMVTLPVSVLGSDGVPAAGLVPEDFVVVDNGVEHEATVLQSPDDSPLDLALLIHLSELMDSVAQKARTSSLSLLDQLSEADCVLYLPFNIEHGTSIWGHPGDTDLRARIVEASLDQGSAPYAAVVLGLYGLQDGWNRCPIRSVVAEIASTEPFRRRALVLLTDGLEEVRAMPFEQALSDANLAGVPIFPIRVGLASVPLNELAEAASDPYLPMAREAWLAVGQLRQLAEATGGQVIDGGWNLQSLPVAFDELLQWLRSYYVVGYSPAPPAPGSMDRELPAWHEVEIRVRRSGVQVHTRPGYYRSFVDHAAARKHVEAARDLLSQGEPEDALAELALAVEADPYDWEALYQRGRALAFLEEPKAAQQALLEAAALNPGQGDVHKLACLVSLDLDDDETAWEQAIRAHQAEMNMTEELRLLRAEDTEPADLELRLQAPRIFLHTVMPPDPVARAALRRMSRTWASVLAEVPEIGLIDLEALAQYELTIEPLHLASTKPRALEAVLTLIDSDGIEVSRESLTLSDIDDQERVVTEIAPHIDELRALLSGESRESR